MNPAMNPAVNPSVSAATGTWSYRPGQWYAALGPHTSAVLPASEKALALDLFDLVDGEGSFENALDRITQGGLSRLSAFALVGIDGSRATIVLRGGVSARATTEVQSIELTGTGAATWAEAVLDEVTSLSISVDVDGADEDHGVSGDLLILGGLVRVCRIDHPPYEPEPEPALEPDPEPEAGAVLEPEPEPEPQSDPEPDGGADLAQTELFDTPLAEEPPGGPLPVVTPPGDPDGDHDGQTRIGEESDEFARPQPGIPGQIPAPSITRPVAKLLISTGETVEVDRVVLIGRAPEARRFTSTDQPRLITVPSPLQEISSTHVEIRPGSGADHGSAVITDLGSTNGTQLEQPGLPSESLQPGMAVQLIPGAVINLGDSLTIQVTQP